jgi:hypothetical protein
MSNSSRCLVSPRTKHIEELLDEAGMESFPASDPPAVSVPPEEPAAAADESSVSPASAPV